MPDLQLLIAWVVGLLVAFGAAVALVLAMAGLLHAEGALRRWRHVVIVPLLVAGVSLSGLLSGRDLRAVNDMLDGPGVGGTLTTLMNMGLRLITVALVLMALAAVVASRFHRHRHARPAASDLPALDPAGGARWLLASFWLYVAANAIVNAAFGAFPAFSHNALYLPVVVLSLYLARGRPLAELLVPAKWALAAMMVLGLLAAALKPELAIQPGYKGLLPGLGFRFWGVGSSPNSTGPLALLVMLLEVHQPAPRRWQRVLLLLLGGVVLLLSQSKTTWGVALAVVPILHLYRRGEQAGRGGPGLGELAAVFIGLALLATGLAAGLLGGIGNAMSNMADPVAANDVQTLTGRTRIWDAALAAWQLNPWFGYGPTAWGLEHRIALGMPFAVSAHNQFLQSLSAAGILGLATLLVHLVLLAGLLVRRRRETRGLSLALLLFLLIRCATETPLPVGTMFNGDVIALLLMLQVAWSSPPRRAEA
ncbi:O-antigen ligase family protein [Leptothrix sp. BB-4]